MSDIRNTQTTGDYSRREFLTVRLSSGAVLTVRSRDYAVIRAYIMLGSDRITDVEPAGPNPEFPPPQTGSDWDSLWASQAAKWGS